MLPQTPLLYGTRASSRPHLPLRYDHKEPREATIHSQDPFPPHVPTVATSCVPRKLLRCPCYQEQPSPSSATPQIMAVMPLAAQDEMHRAFADQGTARTFRCLQTSAATPTESRITLNYLNKGAANVIFQIHAWQHSSSATSFLFAELRQDDDPSQMATPLHRQHFVHRVAVSYTHL